MGNLTCSHHAAYLHTIYATSREIHILSAMQILGKEHLCKIHYKECPFRSDALQTCPSQAILVSDWLSFKNLLLYNR
jgi:hypothetical protein